MVLAEHLTTISDTTNVWVSDAHCVVGALVGDRTGCVGAVLVGGREALVITSMLGASVVGATVVGASVVGASVVGWTVVGATVVGAYVTGASVVGAHVS